MSETPDSEEFEDFSNTPVAAERISEKRLLTLTLIVAVTLVAATIGLEWRVTAGVALGGLLSILNIYWLKISIAALFAAAPDDGVAAQFNSSLFVLRYAIIGALIAVVAVFQLVSVAATFVGLLSFAFAILLEAIIQIFIYIISNREEN